MLREENRLFGLAGVFVLLATLAVMVAAPARAGSWTVGADYSILRFAAVWLVCAAVATFVVQRALPRPDLYLTPLAYLVAGWGILLIWRLAPEFAARQPTWLAIGPAPIPATRLLTRRPP